MIGVSVWRLKTFLAEFLAENSENESDFSSSFPKTPVPWKIIALPSLQWHSRLARRTYKSVLTKKCEGREFEPPREQGFLLVHSISLKNIRPCQDSNLESPDS